MSRTKALKNVKLTSFDDLFGGKVVEETAETGDVKEIPLSELHEFHNHPFQVRSDEELEEMIESVREHGVLVPGIVRKREQGGYEIIAGHTRKHVCEMLGLETMPVFVKVIKRRSGHRTSASSRCRWKKWLRTRIRATAGMRLVWATCSPIFSSLSHGTTVNAASGLSMMELSGSRIWRTLRWQSLRNIWQISCICLH